MLKLRMMLNIAPIVALVLGLCLVVVGEDGGNMPSSVRPLTPSVQSGEIQTPDSDLNERVNFEAAKAARLAEMEAEKAAVAVYIPLADASAPRSTGDDCTDPILLTVNPGSLPYSDLGQTTCGRGNNYDNTCLGGWDGGEDIIYELNVTEAMSLKIQLDPKGTSYTGFLFDDACPADASTCLGKSVRVGSDPHETYILDLVAGTYYIMVDTWPAPDCLPDFDLTIEEYVVSPGDSCGDPIVVKLPDDLVGGPNNDSYIDENYTCGRGNNYDNTCLEEEYNFDGGEDIIYMLDVSETITVDVFVDPGSTTWTGMLIDDNCPPDEVGCIQFSWVGEGALGVYDVTLDPGIYYVMVDTWPAPDCIPSFTLTVRSVEDRMENDAWETCMSVGNVVDLPFSTKQATPDGPGGCLTSPTLWYCYTATCTGTATFSLCGSSYNTKMGVWDGTNPFTDPLLDCNDDACGQQSEVVVDVVSGNAYLIGVGGWKDNVGDGILNISCLENDNCEYVTPVPLTDGVPVTFVGDNTHATHQCDFFDGAHTWHAFTLDTTMRVTLDYCATEPAFTNAWLNLALGCPCTDISSSGEYDWETCGDANVTITWDVLQPGTYYYPVMVDEGAQGPYTLHVVGEAVAVYCSASGDCSGGSISRVAVGTIDNSSSCDDGYSDFTGQSTTMEAGLSYPITIELGSGVYLDIGMAWVDWNQDFLFEYSEEVDLDVGSGEGPYTGYVNPPANATNGPTRMRVRVTYESYPTPCGITDHGEVEDYTIIVEGGGCCVIRGDIDDSGGEVDISDLVYLVDYMFNQGPEPPCMEAADVDGSGGDLNIADLVHLVDYMFNQGPEPVPCP